MSFGQVYIIRHGNTFDKGDVILRVGRRTDLPLSVSGMRQSKHLGESLKDIEFQDAYSSNLKRTRQTVEAILGDQNYHLAEFLREVDYGPDEGCPETEVINRIGRDALHKWDTHAIPPVGWRVDTQSIRTAWQAFLATCHPENNTLVVTSNGVARFLLDVVAGGESATKKLRTGAYGVISLSSNGPILLSWDVRPEA